MDNQELIEAIKTLNESVASLNAIQTDIFNVDTSHDDMVSLKNRMSELMKSNATLAEAVGGLNGAVNDLTEAMNKLSKRI